MIRETIKLRLIEASKTPFRDTFIITFLLWGVFSSLHSLDWYRQDPLSADFLLGISLFALTLFFIVKSGDKIAEYL